MLLTGEIFASASGLADKLVPSISPCGPDSKVAKHTLQRNHKHCTVFKAAFLVSSHKTLLEYSPFLLPDYCWHLPMTPNRRLPCWPRKDCTLVLFSKMLWQQHWLWELLSFGLTELIYIPAGSQWCIGPMAFRRFQKGGLPEFGMGAQIPEQPRILTQILTAPVWMQTDLHRGHQDPLVWGGQLSLIMGEHFTSQPETVSTGTQNPPAPPLSHIRNASSVFCKIRHFPCTMWQRRTYRLNLQAVCKRMQINIQTRGASGRLPPPPIFPQHILVPARQEAFKRY